MKPTLRSMLGLLALVVGVGAAQQWWAQRHDADIGAQLAALVQPGDIRMLASESCSVCAAARVWFSAHRIAYTECLIERDAACRADFEATRSPGTPVLLVRGRPLVGFNPQALQQALAGRG